MRFRLFLIMFGFALIGLTYSFPLWADLLQPADAGVVFPGLTEEQSEAFIQLPVERQADYREVLREDAPLAVRMVTAALEPPVVVPADEQENPAYEGQQVIRRGSFVSLSPNREVRGNVEIYELPDGTRYLWLSDFSAINAPGLRLFLSPSNTVTLNSLRRGEEFALSNNDLPLDPLRATVGNQMYDIPREARLSEYNSILIYSMELNLLWGMANIR